MILLPLENMAPLEPSTIITGRVAPNESATISLDRFDRYKLPVTQILPLTVIAQPLLSVAFPLILVLAAQVLVGEPEQEAAAELSGNATLSNGCANTVSGNIW